MTDKLRLPRSFTWLNVTQFLGALLHYAIMTRMRRLKPRRPELVDDEAYVHQLSATFSH